MKLTKKIYNITCICRKGNILERKLIVRGNEINKEIISWNKRFKKYRILYLQRKRERKIWINCEK